MRDWDAESWFRHAGFSAVMGRLSMRNEARQARLQAANHDANYDLQFERYMLTVESHMHWMVRAVLVVSGIAALGREAK